MTKIITVVLGQDHAGDPVFSARVGFKGVTSIEKGEENLGTYGIVWYEVYEGSRHSRSYNAQFVAEVHYEEKE